MLWEGVHQCSVKLMLGGIFRPIPSDYLSGIYGRVGMIKLRIRVHCSKDSTRLLRSIEKDNKTVFTVVTR
jgi:hypothetical protein